MPENDVKEYTMLFDQTYSEKLNFTDIITNKKNYETYSIAKSVEKLKKRLPELIAHQNKQKNWELKELHINFTSTIENHPMQKEAQWKKYFEEKLKKSDLVIRDIKMEVKPNKYLHNNVVTFYLCYGEGETYDELVFAAFDNVDLEDIDGVWIYFEYYLYK